MKTLNLLPSSPRALAGLAAAGLLGLTVLAGCQRADSAGTVPVSDAAPSPTPTPAVAPGTYRLDAAHSEIGFRVKHLGLSTVKGTFGEADAVVTVGDGLGSLKAEATIAAASVDTGEKDRDDHLRLPDFFDAAQHPAITFVSRAVVPGDGGRFTLKGDLTIRGVTRSVELAAEYLGAAVDPWGNQKVAFTAEGRINRKDFGLNWNKVLEAGGVLVGDEVTLVLDVQAARQN